MMFNFVVHEYFVVYAIFLDFWFFFHKPPGGGWRLARRLISVKPISGLGVRTDWRQGSGRQALQC